MAIGEYFNLSEAQKRNLITRFIKEHPSTGDEITFDRLLDAMTTVPVEKPGPVSGSYPRAGLSEGRVWETLCAPYLRDLPDNVRAIWQYGLTEMINNAIDHSGAETVTIHLLRENGATEGVVIDNGVGIFLKVQHALDLYDPREAIFELAKGKLTTDPASHSGEGIFFTSRVFDSFDIRSGALQFSHSVSIPDFLIDCPTEERGTVVFMRLANDSNRKTKEVFDEFTSPDGWNFSKTVVPMSLAQYEGEKLIARSQAKRLIARFERFRTVVLDFEGVEEIGQGFADEVFRVFGIANPDTELIPIHMHPGVEDMIKHVRPKKPESEDRTSDSSRHDED